MVHLFIQSGRPEWVGLVFLQRYFEEMSGHKWSDVHNNHAPEIKDIDFYVDDVSVDLKADTYFANLRMGEQASQYKKRNSGNLALETISTDFHQSWHNDLEPDPAQPRMVMGWMHTSRAQQIWYYFLTLDNPPQELNVLADGRTSESEAGGIA